MIDSADGDEKKRKESKKFLFNKKDSKDKGYSSLSGDPSQDSVFLVNTKNSKKSKADNKISTVFKKSFKDEKRLKEIKESKEGRFKVLNKKILNSVSIYFYFKRA